MIKSVHNNQHRTKDQLIALYMFWLRNGTDQKSLAVMFGNKTSQRRISDYLKQIRVAISKDIVPKYLGANKNREEYLQYNTKMTNKLFQLADDDLVIVVDGTYCSIEKSNNNSFQYSTYSCQQKDSLFKPFLVCCADGYIIDMYGPFAANDNDATIFDYIYNNDEDLKRILVPQKTLILMDKGKTADIHKINDYFENVLKVVTNVKNLLTLGPKTNFSSDESLYFNDFLRTLSYVAARAGLTFGSL
jgi:hypothetical protein